MCDHKCEHSPKNVSGLVSSSTSFLRRSASLFQVCARSSKTLLSSGLAVRSASFRHSSACLLYSSSVRMDRTSVRVRVGIAALKFASPLNHHVQIVLGQYDN